MFKRFLGVLVFVLCLTGAFQSDLIAQFGPEDITVQPGYRVFKIAETNRIVDPYRLTFDPSGNLLVAGYNYMIYRIDPSLNIQIIGKTRKYNITPTEIEVSPDGETYVIRSYVYTYAIYVFNPPDSYTQVISASNIYAIGYDKLGNFYAAILVYDPDANRNYFDIVRYDSNFQPVETTFRNNTVIRDFAFDGDNNLYALAGGSNTVNNGVILKILAGDNGIPGPDDPWLNHATGLYSAGSMAMDDNGNFYLDEYLTTESDGFSSYTQKRLTKVSSSGIVMRDLGPVFQNCQGLACRDNYLYVSENDRGVISRVDLTTFEKSDFTEDTGVDAAGPIAWDNYDNLYTSSFRQLRMLKLNAGGTFDQFGPGTGYMQSIAFDGSDFYIGSAPTTGEPVQILKIDPVNGGQTQVATNVGGWRSVAFDAFSRLILNTIISDPENQFGADIIDTATGTVTPYLIGLHNKGRCIRFDGRQNIYFVEGTGDGIKKIALAPYYSPPRDVAGEPLTYDFVTPGYASPTIYFFAVNPQEELFVPRMDSGDVLFCEPGGSVTSFAQGFIMPNNASIDRFGALYISDSANGIYKIVHERWTIPAVVIIKDMMLDEIRGSAIDTGLKNSLIVKLENADKQLERGSLTITPAINMITAFMNEVKAQYGKGIPEDQAARWIETAEKIINALREVA